MRFDNDPFQAYRAYTLAVTQRARFEERLDTLAALIPGLDEVPFTTTPGDPRPLFLFNVLVALEWEPTQQYLNLLKEAFRRASDFLYDVMDGYMAFGQVIFGGPELMAAADIQIVASNRLHPRAWVEGLHNTKKYMPIRVGRGLWNTRDRYTIEWNEPESYRTLVHEWLHYAVCLKDRYLEVKQTSQGTSVAVPKSRFAGTSVMESTLVSEVRSRKLEEIKDLLEVYFSGLPTQDWQRLDGPPRLPLPLPQFYRLPPSPVKGSGRGQAAPKAAARLLALTYDGMQALLRQCSLAGDMLPFEHCWLYVVRPSKDKDEEAPFSELIPQGTLHDMTPPLTTPQGNCVVVNPHPRSFPVLGVEQGDIVLFVVAIPGSPAQVFARLVGLEVDTSQLTLERMS